MRLFKKNPTKKLTKRYQEKMTAAMVALRNGDVRTNAVLTAEADEIKAQIDQIAEDVD